MIEGRPLRSILFAPANMPKLVLKMPKAGADINAVDLEDGTPPAEKVTARLQAMQAAHDLREGRWTGKLFIRTNHPRDRHFLGDVVLAAEGEFDGVVVPKVGHLSDVERLAESLELVDPKKDRLPHVILGIESGGGVMHLGSLLDAADRVVAVYFGAEDFATSIGAVRTPSNEEVLYARSHVALHAKTRGISAFDQGVVEFKDDDRFVRESKKARQLGFTGKICVHPKQAELANDLFLPTADEIADAKRLLSEYEKALANGVATPAIDGRMIDGPLVVRARNILALAQEEA